MKNLWLTTAMLLVTASAQPLWAQQTAGELFALWASEDGILTVEEWDAGIDSSFGEQAVDLGPITWDTDTDGIITMVEFEAGAESSGVFQELTATEPAPEDMDRVLANHNADTTDSAITLDNVGQLQQIWSVESEHPISHVPLIEGDRIFFADWGGTVYAADAASGEVLWQNTIAEPMTQWPWHGFAGTGATDGDRVYQASVEGTAYALDAETGEVLWQTEIAEDEHAGNQSRLMTWDGLLFIGLQSVEEPLTAMMENFEPNFRGKVLALDAATGEIVWETQLVEEPHNGVAVWSSFAVDPMSGTLYFTTGNNYTGEATELSDAIVAVDARTGEIKWAHQTTEHDVWTMAMPEGPDYDFAGGPQLFTAVIDGQPRLLVGAGQKSGIFHTWDASTGEPLWATSIGYGGVDGGIHGEASIGGDRIIAWSNNSYIHTAPPEQHPASIKALNPATGSHLWVNDKAQPAEINAAGYLSGNVYFLGSLDRSLRAYNAQDGSEVWSTETPGPIISSVRADDGRVFVSTGAPALFGDWAGGRNTVTAFGMPE
ncbi:PQQ-binding-like beta-propeller repeat protein [Loktanella sp. DJP18]|uniref:outer membrane protein assembly factor BamB family protein n=1 Tax=Loktanella sp. DJP18 TaxID=3409788 RepID=UPI003BB6A95B